MTCLRLLCRNGGLPGSVIRILGGAAQLGAMDRAAGGGGPRGKKVKNSVPGLSERVKTGGGEKNPAPNADSGPTLKWKGGLARCKCGGGG